MSTEADPKPQANAELAELQRTLEQVAAPWVAALGLRLLAAGSGSVTMTLPVSPPLVHSGGVLCGQALMAAADTAMILAISQQLGGFRPMTTVQLQTSFLRPVAANSGRSAGGGPRVARRQEPGVRRDRDLQCQGRPGCPCHHHLCAAVKAPTLDYRTAFELAPIGLVISRQRLIVDCNARLLAMFGASREQLVGGSFAVLYPTADEFQRTGQRIATALDAQGGYADERIMKRCDGELFWCHVSGRALNQAQPHEAAGIWAFEDLSSKRTLKVDLTPREREIAALLIEGLTSKLIGKRLGISPRTVDVYRTRLMRKLGAGSTAELVNKLLS